MALTQFFLLDQNQAALVRGTTSLGHALDPRTIDNGPLAGSAVLPLAVLSDVAHEKAWLFMLSLPTANIDPDVAWPPEPEPI